MQTRMEQATTSGQEPPRLVDEVRNPSVDPCDLACEAMPAHVVGDLCAQDEKWLHEHTEECNYCRNELRRYDTLEDALQACGGICADVDAPPPVALPTRDRVWYTHVDSPIGDLILAATSEGLREIDFGKEISETAFVTRVRQSGAEPVPMERSKHPDPEARLNLQRAAKELEEYFGGERARFDIPLDWGAMPPFQRSVLEATASVPFGHVDTYAGIARRIGNPKATRAVGNALGRNPIPVIVPCHRVIRSDASLGGYTGGIGIKQRLLNLEGITLT
jgi:methylated-DNA-[protein]-cysteine S-methyltransferase